MCRFLDAYIQSEPLAHKLIGYHYKDTDRDYKEKTLNIKRLKLALDFYHINFEYTEALFSTHISYKRGHMTPRQLRNNYVHRRPVNDAKEILERADYFLKIMKDWEETIYKFFQRH